MIRNYQLHFSILQYLIEDMFGVNLNHPAHRCGQWWSPTVTDALSQKPCKDVGIGGMVLPWETNNPLTHITNIKSLVCILNWFTIISNIVDTLKNHCYVKANNVKDLMCTILIKLRWYWIRFWDLVCSNAALTPFLIIPESHSRTLAPDSHMWAPNIAQLWLMDDRIKVSWLKSTSYTEYFAVIFPTQCVQSAQFINVNT